VGGPRVAAIALTFGTIAAMKTFTAKTLAALAATF
jgi:preprotein translocase subunit SecA